MLMTLSFLIDFQFAFEVALCRCCTEPVLLYCTGWEIATG
jgi:hypothetical protein